MLFLFHDTQLFLTPAADGTWLPLAAASFTPIAGSLTFDLPAPDGTPCRAARVVETALPGARLWNLRAAHAVLPPTLYALATKAAELLHWDAHTRFCPVCGARLERQTEISKCCPACGEEQWPQLQTAVLVLVERDDEVLLVQSRSFRHDFYGLVAGFVETGESLEDCVRREVREETGLEITPPRYVASQPWPFPIQLMVGFRARYAAGTLRLQDEELRKGGWFTPATLPTLPSPPSLARKMIDMWLQERGA